MRIIACDGSDSWLLIWAQYVHRLIVIGHEKIQFFEPVTERLLPMQIETPNQGAV